MPSAPRVTVRRSGTRGSSGGPTRGLALVGRRGGALEGRTEEPTASRNRNSPQAEANKFPAKCLVLGPGTLGCASIRAGRAGGGLLPHALQYFGEAPLFHDAVEARAVVPHHARALRHHIHDARHAPNISHHVVDAERLLPRVLAVLGDCANDLTVL